MQLRQNRSPGTISLSLRDPFPSTLLLGADQEFIEAVEQGVKRLRAYLAQRHQEFAQAQENYRQEISTQRV